jgi:phospholipid/cholesterol/gamma-HCH transport system substrate-binding protein
MSVRREGRSAIRRRHGRRGTVGALAGLITIAAIFGFILLAENSYNGLPFLSYRTLYVSLPNIGHLQQHDAVDIAGVRAGQVLTTTTRNDRALVELQLQGVGSIPANSRVIVRADGLLGSRYVELDPGNSRKLLPNGATIVAGPDSYYNGVPEALNLFDPKTRTALGEMINGLGAGLLGRGSQINQAIHVGAPWGADLSTISASVLSRPGAAAAFLPSVNSGMAAMDGARNDLAGGFAPAAQALRPFTDRRRATDEAVSDAPGTEHAVDDNLSTPGLRLLASLQTLGRAADGALPTAPAALRAATGLLQAAPQPLRQTKTVLAQVPDAAPSTLAILAALRPDLKPLRQAFNKLVDPVTNLAEHGCDIQNMFDGTRSLTGYGKLPGGPWGPDGGFPLTVLAGPEIANRELDTGFKYPRENLYPPPCAYSPGAVMNTSTVPQLLQELLP